MKQAAGAAALLLTVVPWQPALAYHSLVVGAQARRVSRDIVCTSNTVVSIDEPVALQVTDTAGQAFVSMDYGTFRGSADVAVQSGTAVPLNPFSVESAATGSASDTWLITGGSGVGYLLMEAHIRAPTFGTTILGSELTTGYLRGSATDAMPGRAACREPPTRWPPCPSRPARHSCCSASARSDHGGVGALSVGR